MSGAGPLHPAFAPFARAAAFAYGLGVRANAAWWGFRRPADAGVPVVSVGNVSAGGTGGVGLDIYARLLNVVKS